MFVWRFTRRSGSLFSLRGTAGGKRRGFSGLSRDTIAKMCPMCRTGPGRATLYATRLTENPKAAKCEPYRQRRSSL